ncbi:MAG TPA: hypothetical protein VFB54_03125 [Burkholderiales bacterium]|nr:hypothetical protein [Burkholderiales bacterium]
MVFGLLTLLVFLIVMSVIGAFVRADGHLHLHDRTASRDPTGSH